jgi:hypothetical protein
MLQCMPVLKLKCDEVVSIQQVGEILPVQSNLMVEYCLLFPDAASVRVFVICLQSCFLHSTIKSDMVKKF